MLFKEDCLSVITKKSPSGSSYKTYVFKCKCGTDIKAQQVQLKTHSGKCRSCTQKKRPYEHILSELVHTCNKRNKAINLTYEDFIDIIKNNYCHYCHKELFFEKHTRDNKGNYTSRAYQLDRKDNNLGYLKDNVVTCCWECNRLKSDIYTYDEFMLLSPVLKQIENNRIK